MSRKYDQFLIEHRAAVFDCWQWFKKHLPNIAKDAKLDGFKHDASKEDPAEYKAYDAYFYGEERTPEIEKAFEYAWLLHIHRNPHHWQYWILINDNPEEGEILIEMPYNYILEMICDWWAFSWSKGNLNEIFPWYEQRKNYIKLHPNSRKTLESILGQIKIKLEEQNNDV